MAYSLLTTAINNSQAENRSVEFWNFPPEDTWGNHTNAEIFAKRYITPYLDIVYDSDTPGRGRFFAGRNDQWFLANRYSVCNYQARDSYMIRLKNGMSMAILNRGTQMYRYVKVVVDIDGPEKGGSIMGRDVFYFSIGTFYPSTANKAACQNPQKKRYALSPGVPHHCGTTGFFMTQAQLANNPNEWFALYKDDNGGCGGQDCGASAGCEASVHIIKNDFKIPSYYPLNRMAKRGRE